MKLLSYSALLALEGNFEEYNDKLNILKRITFKRTTDKSLYIRKDFIEHKRTPQSFFFNSFLNKTIEDKEKNNFKKRKIKPIQYFNILEFGTIKTETNNIDPDYKNDNFKFI